MIRTKAMLMALCFTVAGVARADRPTNVKRCVRFRQAIDREAQQVTLRLKSRCDAELACTIRWKVDCEGDARDRHEARSFGLESGESEAIAAEASSCGEGDWGIVGVRWTCDTVDR